MAVLNRYSFDSFVVRTPNKTPSRGRRIMYHKHLLLTCATLAAPRGLKASDLVIVKKKFGTIL